MTLNERAELIVHDIKMETETNPIRIFKYNKKKPKVAFICVHNSCRSQIAECLGRHFASDVFESYSAGT